MGVDTEPGEDIKDHAKEHQEIESQAGWVEKSKGDAEEANKQQSYSRVQRKEYNHWFYELWIFLIDTKDEEAGDDDGNETQDNIDQERVEHNGI